MKGTAEVMKPQHQYAAWVLLGIVVWIYWFWMC
jgi:hypothetical protein